MRPFFMVLSLFFSLSLLAEDQMHWRITYRTGGSSSNGSTKQDDQNLASYLCRVKTNRISQYGKPFDVAVPSSGRINKLAWAARYGQGSRTTHLNIFFKEDQPTDEWSSLSARDLDQNDRLDISKFVKSHPNATGFQIKGYADACGEANYNYDLSKKRVHIVKIMTEATRINYGITKSSLAFDKSYHGERHSGEHHSEHRRVTLSPLKHGWIRSLENSPTDYYLIDQSGSMSRTWNALRNFYFLNGKKVYTATTSNICSDSYVGEQKDLRILKANGATRYYQSLYKLLLKMPKGKSITLISDFDSETNDRARFYGKVRALIAEKSITVKNVHPR